MAKAVIGICSTVTTVASGNINLCVGLLAGIEGVFHALSKGYRHALLLQAAAASSCMSSAAKHCSRATGLIGVVQCLLQGLTQGNPLSMILYGVGMLLLSEQLLAEFSQLV